MFCKDCGTQLENGTRFCPNCGSAQAVTPPPRPVIPPTAPVPFAEKVRATAKKVGSSPAFLIAIICFTLTLFLHLLTLQPAGSTYTTFEDLFTAFNIAQPDSLETLTLVTGIISMLPGILIATGLWITYGTCVSRKPKANTAGLTMIFVVNLVELILTSLVLLGALVLMIIVYHTEPWQLNGADADFEKAICLAIIITLAATFAFALLSYIKVCTTASNVRNTLRTGMPNRRASRFVGVLCFISGVMLVLLGGGNLMMGLAILLPSAFLSALSNLLTAASQILFGVLIFSYRSKMAALEAEERMNNFRTLSHAEPYTSPVYIPPQPAEEPAPAPEAVEEAPEPEVTEEPAEPEETTEPATEEETN